LSTDSILGKQGRFAVATDRKGQGTRSRHQHLGRRIGPWRARHCTHGRFGLEGRTIQPIWMALAVGGQLAKATSRVAMQLRRIGQSIRQTSLLSRDVPPSTRTAIPRHSIFHSHGCFATRKQYCTDHRSGLTCPNPSMLYPRNPARANRPCDAHDRDPAVSHE
jgi:hypothetical protein